MKTLTVAETLTAIARNAGWTVTDRTSLISRATTGRTHLRFNAVGVEIDAHFTSANGFLDVFYLATPGVDTSVVDSREHGAAAVMELLMKLILDLPRDVKRVRTAAVLDSRDSQASAWSQGR